MNTTIWIELASEEYRCDIIISPVPYNTFPGGLDGKESSCNAGELSLIPGLGRSPGGGHRNPLSNLAWRMEDYSPWGCKESDTAERLFHFQHISAQCLLTPLKSSSLRSFLIMFGFPNKLHLQREIVLALLMGPFRVYVSYHHK